MTSRLVGRLLVYPLVLLCGMALGSDFRPNRVSTYPSGAFPNNGNPGSPAFSRGGAESAELRALRLAERELFPELSGLDPDAAVAAQWDQPLGDSDDTGGDGNGQSTHLDSDRPTTNFLAHLNKPDLPIRRHQRVLRYINYFSKSAQGRKLFTTWLKRSGQYQNVIEDELRARNLPLDLRAIVFIESGFWPTARSKAGAVGLWQFMPRTARVYGLVVDGNYDERRSIWRSTEAAVQHLDDLHENLHSWDLALAAYNYGHDNVTRRMEELGSHDFWDLSAVEGGLPVETALYVPKVLAVAVILRNLEYFGFEDIELAEPLEATAIKVPPGIRMSLIARAAGTSARTIREYNPEIREDVIPDRGGPVVIHIPQNGLARARAMLPKLIQEQSGDDGLDLSASLDFDWGEDEFGTEGRSPLERLSNTNNPSKTKTAKPVLKPKAHNRPSFSVSPLDYQSDDAGADKNLLAAPPSTEELVSIAGNGQARPGSVSSSEPTWRALRGLPRTRVVHQVEPGDTIWRISEVYGVSRLHIIRSNKLTNPDVLTVGRKLVMDVPTPQKAESATTGGATSSSGDPEPASSATPDGGGASSAKANPTRGASNGKRFIKR